VGRFSEKQNKRAILVMCCIQANRENYVISSFTKKFHYAASLRRARLLEKEGHASINKCKRLFVKDFEKKLIIT